jgi:hypothetical protein
MPHIEIFTPRDLADQLIRIFPDFAREWDEGEGFGYTKGDYKLHTVFLTFGPVSSELFRNATPDQKREFCSLVNELVAKGGDFENAVSTCFLEHASSLGALEYIEPYLSEEAKRECF